MFDWRRRRRETGKLQFVVTLLNGADVYTNQAVRKADRAGVVFKNGSRIDAYGSPSGTFTGTVELRGPGTSLVRLDSSTITGGITIRDSTIQNSKFDIC
jgi:hypothetical protein